MPTNLPDTLLKSAQLIIQTNQNRQQLLLQTEQLASQMAQTQLNLQLRDEELQARQKRFEAEQKAAAAAALRDERRVAATEGRLKLDQEQFDAERALRKSEIAVNEALAMLRRADAQQILTGAKDAEAQTFSVPQARQVYKGAVDTTTRLAWGAAVRDGKYRAVDGTERKFTTDHWKTFASLDQTGRVNTMQRLVSSAETARLNLRTEQARLSRRPDSKAQQDAVAAAQSVVNATEAKLESLQEVSSAYNATRSYVENDPQIVYQNMVRAAGGAAANMVAKVLLNPREGFDDPPEVQLIEMSRPEWTSRADVPAHIIGLIAPAVPDTRTPEDEDTVASNLDEVINPNAIRTRADALKFGNALVNLYKQRAGSDTVPAGLRNAVVKFLRLRGFES